MEQEKSIEVTYKFYLPQQQEELNKFSKGSEYASVLWDIDQMCRSALKYGDPEKINYQQILEEIRSLINDEVRP